MLSTISSGALLGMKAFLVQVEVDCSTGLPGFTIVGHLSGEVREARERVQVALRNTGFSLRPIKVTVNLSPADVRKEGTAFDLPIAVGLLEAMGYCSSKELENTLFLGELGLDGEIKTVRGVLPIVKEAAENGIKRCVVPRENSREAASIPGIQVIGAENIKDLLEYLSGRTKDSTQYEFSREKDWDEEEKKQESTADFSQVRGQEAAKRAAEIAAAGFHNLLMIGPPGTGKSMIAKRIPGILPPLTTEESLEVSAIYSIAGLLDKSKILIRNRPFQSPHHSITQTSLTGGGIIPKPGAVSLAHRGVLFMDELPEFGKSILDSLRQPLEEHQVHIARLHGNVSYPADFMLICAMNPCPCGYYPDKNRCICKEADIRRYLSKISGPILDRIDLCVEVLPVDLQKLRREKEKGEKEQAQTMIKRILKARECQRKRFQNSPCRFNADIAAADIDKYCLLGKKEQRLTEEMYHTFQLSARSYHRLLKVGRTIADLEGAERIQEKHLMEAAYYRTAEQQYWRKQDERTT